MRERRVLVTGGAGFIGSHVADAYLERGDRVWIVDDLSSGRRENLPAAATFVEMSVCDDRLSGLFQDVGGFDVVNHHAAQIDVRRSVTDPRMDARINVDGLLNVLECVGRHGAQRVIFVSSGGVVYGEPEQRPTPEVAPKQPLSPYGVSKLAAEFYLHYYRQVHGMDYVALRYSNVYGPRQDPHGEAGVVAIFSNRLLAGQPLCVFGDGEQTRDYVYVGDVVAANMLMSEAELPPARVPDDRAYNVGTGVGTSVRELAALLMEVSATEVPLETAPARSGELRHSCLAIDRLLEAGWAPGTPIREGLSRTYSYIEDERTVRAKC